MYVLYEESAQALFVSACVLAVLPLFIYLMLFIVLAMVCCYPMVISYCEFMLEEEFGLLPSGGSVLLWVPRGGLAVLLLVDFIVHGLGFFSLSLSLSLSLVSLCLHHCSKSQCCCFQSLIHG